MSDLHASALVRRPRPDHVADGAAPLHEIHHPGQPCLGNGTPSLYTIWQKGSVREIDFAVVHCTGGDILIASISLLGGLFILGNACWPYESYVAVAAFAFVAGAGYTIFSEWINTTVRTSWAYTDSMPTLPAIGGGLSPLAQWIVIPFAAFWWAQRRHATRIKPTEETS